MKNSLGQIIKWSIVILILFVIAFLAIKIGAIYEHDPERSRQLGELTTLVAALGQGAWSFIKPFLQLIVILYIVDWVLNRLGVSLSQKGTNLEWNIQTVIALIVVSAFSIAALAGINNSVGALKDLALVVVGFYFGTQKRSVNLKSEKGEVTVVEEHENELRVEADKGEEEK